MRSNELGTYIENRRRQHGWSQKQLSLEAGVSLRWIASIESGHWQGAPSDATLAAVATALHEHPTTLSELLHRDLGYPPAEVRTGPIQNAGSMTGLPRGTLGPDPSPSDQAWQAVATALQLAADFSDRSMALAATIANIFIPSPDQQDQLTGRAARLVAQALLVRGLCGLGAFDPHLTALADFEAAQRLAEVAHDRELRYQADLAIAQFMIRQADSSVAQGDTRTAWRLYDVAEDQLSSVIAEQESLPEAKRSLLALIVAYTLRTGRPRRPSTKIDLDAKAIDFDAMQHDASRALQYARQAPDHYAVETRHDPWLRWFVTMVRGTAESTYLHYHTLHGSLPVEEMQEQLARVMRELPDMTRAVRHGTLPYCLARRQLWSGDPAKALGTLQRSLKHLDKKSAAYMHWRAKALVQEARDTDRLPLRMTLPCPHVGHGTTEFRIVPGQQHYRCKVRGCTRVLLELP